MLSSAPIFPAMAMGVFACVLFLATPAPAGTSDCPGLSVTVVHEDPIDAENACSGVAAAAEFMASHGFDVDVRLLVRVVEHIETPLRGAVLARYSVKEERIDVLSMEACRERLENKTAFGLAIDKVLHRSFVVHEAAHAIARKNFRFPRPSVVAQEYIAYTVQIGTLPPEYRNRILERTPGEAFGGDGEFSDLFFALNPDLFAVKAYRHFQQPGNGTAFFQRLLDGSFQPDEEVYFRCSVSGNAAPYPTRPPPSGSNR